MNWPKGWSSVCLSDILSVDPQNGYYPDLMMKFRINELRADIDYKENLNRIIA